MLLPPAQDQRYMVAGGGGIGESNRSTARTDVIDLRAAKPHFEPGPDLEQPVRYPNMVITPDDRVVITGGSTGYRGENDSDVLLCHIYDPDSGAPDADGRPDGRAQLPLRGAAAARRAPDHARAATRSTRTPTTQKPGTFEKRIEIYSPPYLFQGDRPEIASGPEEVKRRRDVLVRQPARARGSGRRGWCGRARSPT